MPPSTKIKIEREGVLVIKNHDGIPMGLVYKDLSTRNNIFFTCRVMNMDEIEELFNGQLK